MKECVPCRRRFITWTAFARHAIRTHQVNRAGFWRRANQIGDDPAFLLRSENGSWLLMVQSPLKL